MTDPLIPRLEAILRATPRLMQVMETARGLDLPDWLVFSGAIYQPVWNHLTGRPTDYGLKDYDLGYFDPADLSYEAEDAVIRLVASAFDEPLASMVEVRNQARVHLWFEGRFKEPYVPLPNAAEALTRFVAPAFAVGARLETDGSMTIVAPFGLEDLFDMVLRPNPSRPKTTGWAKAVGSAVERWPELKVVEDED
ncbi:nucleotidyltransferase family protein [Caulobacter sp. 73W]|uniref:Nucleotidyltransferase family protein n=1 Tax=Caulobacter sp. 73W TaxID=3161137 RepID=A0AB39KVQ0_9CAUL